ncbi:MAG TPA: hypothetical protein VFY51_02845 [Pyrinomonadaceae bacterium]|nr:hypothetical protein [Pyrinomonadaceae bacterium]
MFIRIFLPLRVARFSNTSKVPHFAGPGMPRGSHGFSSIAPPFWCATLLVCNNAKSARISMQAKRKEEVLVIMVLI